MKAVYYNGNSEFSVGACEPVKPTDGEIRLDVAYCGVCGTDIHIAHGAMDARVPSPMVIGHEMSGTVAELGAGVEGFAIGDKVVVRPLDNRGETEADRGYSHICKDLKFIGIDSPGAFQNSWTVPAFTVHKLPDDIDLKLAALVEPLAVACHDVRLGKVKEGELAFVLGGGPIGMLVALVAKSAGARVVVSEISPFRLEFAKSLGLEALSPIDTNLEEWSKEQSGGSGADIVFEVSGAKQAAASMTKLLAIRGRIVVVAIYPQPIEINLFDFFWKELSMSGARVYEPEDYEKAIQLIASGDVPFEKLISLVEPLEKLPDVFKQLETNAEAMKVLIDCQS
ncbi:MAG: zinc-binding dehydrogenase [Opitutales bacterium]|jgi:(R,R)-butanediol dehydrogenase / meso-butanediol dehydrogenase / diacetyl reductase|nr:zinc-binding dehydrogenase [Opitutales bacterium]MDP4777378.1 zinc-binding dehydrogenase [Opitutales bacterium]MDP4883385.1 zinc-binding dehydrogenase [Opitutales bacterium]MDP5079669.1 zinc-binding dehydrogenase [Opitutales bacterium]